MTAWAYSNWTSGPTSPSSPIRPASESEQSELPAAAATATGRTRGCRHHRVGGGFFFKLFILPSLFVSLSLTF